LKGQSLLLPLGQSHRRSAQLPESQVVAQLPQWLGSLDVLTSHASSWVPLQLARSVGHAAVLQALLAGWVLLAQRKKDSSSNVWVTQVWQSLPHASVPVHGLQVTPSGWHRVPLGQPVVVPGVHVFPPDEDDPITLLLPPLLTGTDEDETTTALLLLTAREEEGVTALLLGGAAEEDCCADDEETTITLDEGKGPELARLLGPREVLAVLAGPDADADEDAVEEPPTLEDAAEDVAPLVAALDELRTLDVATALVPPPLDELMPTTPEEPPALPEDPLDAPGSCSHWDAVQEPSAQL